MRAFASRLADWLCGFLVLIGCLVAFVPVSPDFPVARIRGAWALALNTAVGQGLVFGRDIDFTFGPFAAIYTRQYNPATDAMMLWGGALIAAAVAAGLLRLSRDRFHPTAILLVAFLPLLALNRDPLFFAPPVIFLLVVHRLTLPKTNPSGFAPSPATHAVLALLTVSLGLLPLIKVTFGAAAGVALALGWLMLVTRARWRTAIATAVLVAVAMPLFWMLGHQPVAELPRFLLGRWLIVSAYNDAMSLDGPAWEPMSVALGCALLVIVHAQRWRTGGSSGALFGIGIVALLFLAFKAGFVRDDVFHLFIAPGVLVLTAWVLAIGVSGNVPMLGLLAALLIWGAIDYAHTGLSVTSAGGRMYGEVREAARGFSARSSGAADLSGRFAGSLRAIREHQFLPPITGPTDAYPNGQDVLLAYGLDWSPRPVIQSYSAYAPGLLAENARHLTGDGAPQNILLQIDPIDGRLPSLEDGLSWPTLLTRYEPIGLFGQVAVLRRRPRPTNESPIGDQPIASGVYGLGVPIPLPAAPRAVWAEIAVAPALPGKLLSVAWKLPLLSIQFDFSDGHAERFRYVAGMGETGFLAFPVVRDTADFIALLVQQSALYASDKRPVAMTIAADGPSGMWSPTISARFFALTVPAQPGLERLLTTPPPAPDASQDAAPAPR